MGEYIKTFSTIHKHDISLVGGKGANLGDLTGKGFPVPPGFVVTANTYNTFFTSLHLKKTLQHLHNARAEDIEHYCAIIRETIITTQLPGELAEAILAAHQKLVETRTADIVCAVRSSATAEDLRDASFAGQHATYYYVERANLLRMVKQCWASLWNTEAVSYRTARGIDHASVYMAVVVQEMIRSEIAGITFTANPVSGAKEEIITEASWGMGAAIVDGRVTPDRYILERESFKLREHRIAEKRFMVYANLQAGAIYRLEEVPHEMRRQETLTLDFLNTVVTWAIKAEEHFGSPQDVEWAIADGRFYMLQSRPITAMGSADATEEVAGQYILFKPAVENLTEPLTPLTADVLAMFFSPLIHFIHGWGYLNLKYVHPIFPFKVSDEELVNLLYGLSSDIRIPLKKLSLLKLPFLLLLSLYTYFTLGVTFARTGNMPDDSMENYRALCHSVEENPDYGPIEAIQRLWFFPKFFDQIGSMPLFVNFSSIRYIGLIGLLKVLIRQWIPDARSDAETLLCSGLEGVHSAEMGREIWALARAAHCHQRLRELWLKYPPEQVLSKIRNEPEAQNFLRLLERFLAKHGHRALKELELQSIRWEEKPVQIIGMIRNYLLVDFEQMTPGKTLTQSRLELEADLRRQLEKYPFERVLRPRWRLIRFLTNQARYFVKLRENSRFYHIIALYIVRKKLLKIERELLSQGTLKCKDDIFFLKLNEIVRMQTGQSGWLDVEERLHKRRLAYVRFSRKTPPKTIGIQLPDTPQRTEYLSEDSIVIPGQSASPGNYEGIAHVILDPSIDTELKPGEILVAPYTDPAWTPLFLTAGAAVVEVGSYLSHAGTVAREYGIPCVVDVAECTKRIQTGDHLNVDGDRGLVKILSDKRSLDAI